jgi:hypothetical protein
MKRRLTRTALDVLLFLAVISAMAAGAYFSMGAAPY